eukprot:scaffold1343_cov217-Pinguiococcus_pyrenoidosus.AAC.4
MVAVQKPLHLLASTAHVNEDPLLSTTSQQVDLIRREVRKGFDPRQLERLEEHRSAGLLSRHLLLTESIVYTTLALFQQKLALVKGLGEPHRHTLQRVSPHPGRARQRSCAARASSPFLGACVGGTAHAPPPTAPSGLLLKDGAVLGLSDSPAEAEDPVGISRRTASLDRRSREGIGPPARLSAVLPGQRESAFLEPTWARTRLPFDLGTFCVLQDPAERAAERAQRGEEGPSPSTPPTDTRHSGRTSPRHALA